MSVFQKSILFILVITILYSCEDNSKKTGELSQFIPEGVSIVFKIQDFEVLKTDIKNNGFLSQLKNTTPLCLSSIDSVIIDSAIISTNNVYNKFPLDKECLNDTANIPNKKNKPIKPNVTQVCKY